MRTLSPVNGAVIAAACAMALLPAGAARAGSGTPPAPSATAGEVTVTAAFPEGRPSSGAARPARR
ncbi:hypothetical protein ACQEU8_29395 [Streptomyces sp. CA-250714]|uniref:hypothetical protein n=1 Tax=Streptomyces sp. CA-250714 TaxID=3240060 RepID=UPI003D92570C